MPLYEYRCHKCGETFEVRQKFADEPVKTHEGCGGEVERLISIPSLQFKGTGWYVTDYGRGSNSGTSGNGKSESKSESKSEGKNGPAESKKTESKTTAKTEPSKSSSDK